MPRPRKYADPRQAAAARAERDRQRRHQARVAQQIQEQVPRFVPCMPLPDSIPPPTPDQLNLRIDVPAIVALSPQENLSGEVRFHGPELPLPYRLSTPLPLPLSTLFQISEQKEEDNSHEASEPNWRKDGDDQNAQDVGDSLWMTNSLSSSRSQTLEPVLISNLDGEDHELNWCRHSNDDKGEEFGYAPSRTSAHQSSAIQTSAVEPALSPAPSPVPYSIPRNHLSNPDAVANDESEREESMDSTDITETIVKHMAEQLYHFKGCLEQEHCKVVQEHQMVYASAKHGDIQQLTKHLQGVANEEASATPLPDILSKPTLMRRRSIPNCDFEQIFEGKIEGRAQSVLPTSVPSTGTSPAPSGASFRRPVNNMHKPLLG